MNRKIFISFLGLGNQEKNPPYDKVKYVLNNNTTSCEKIFVQSAILELSDIDFDKIIIISTKKSSTNISKFKDEILSTNISKFKDEILDIDEKFDTSINDISDDLFDLDGERGAWNWFERLNEKIEFGDNVVLDVTHGFRIVPIVFSAALSYLKRAKNIDILGVLYGAYVPPKKEESYPIVDIKDFYSISDWAEGVGRLIDDADASFLHKIAKKEKSGGFVGLNNVELLGNITKLTESVRNIELQNVENNARNALDVIQRSITTAKPLEKQILRMIVEKFMSLISETPIARIYSKEYLILQMKLIELLATHGLYMQCFTAMREWMGSLGLAICGEYGFGSKNKDEKARRYAEVFVNMLQFEEDKWKFDEREDVKKIKDKLYPSYKSLNNIEEIRPLLVKMQKVRNGFDHGWTGNHINGVPENIQEIYKETFRIYQSIINDNIFKQLPPTIESFQNINSDNVLINLSNHPSANWQAEQLVAAQSFGEVVDLPFPAIPPDRDTVQVENTAHEYLDKCK